LVGAARRGISLSQNCKMGRRPNKMAGLTQKGQKQQRRKSGGSAGQLGRSTPEEL